MGKKTYVQIENKGSPEHAPCVGQQGYPARHPYRYEARAKI